MGASVSPCVEVDSGAYMTSQQFHQLKCDKTLVIQRQGRAPTPPLFSAIRMSAHSVPEYPFHTRHILLPALAASSSPESSPETTQRCVS